MTATNESEPARRVRRAFLDQAGYCDRLGSPFTALLCRLLGERLDPSNEVERYILEWQGDPSAFADSVALRVAGVLHYLVRAGLAPDLAALYPPHASPEPATLLGAARATLLRHEPLVRQFLQSAPQTNEVGRSAALIAGWLEVASATGLPLCLFEIGASAGLNLIADRYGYRFGDTHWSPRRDVGLTITCEWTGRKPAIEAPLQIQSRAGCDRNPLDIADPTQRERLIAYVWADQTQRLARLQAAIATMLMDPVAVETADAADWVARTVPVTGASGVARVVFHSIVWGYLTPASQQLIANRLAEIGATASTDRPLAWLRLELAGKDQPAELRLTLWPPGEDKLLARAHPHGHWVRWCD